MVLRAIPAPVFLSLSVHFVRRKQKNAPSVRRTKGEVVVMPLKFLSEAGIFPLVHNIKIFSPCTRCFSQDTRGLRFTNCSKYLQPRPDM